MGNQSLDCAGLEGCSGFFRVVCERGSGFRGLDIFLVGRGEGGGGEECT